MAAGMERDNWVCSATAFTVALAVKQPKRYSPIQPDGDFTGSNLPLHQTLRVSYRLLLLSLENQEESSNTMFYSTLG